MKDLDISVFAMTAESAGYDLPGRENLTDAGEGFGFLVVGNARIAGDDCWRCGIGPWEPVTQQDIDDSGIGTIYSYHAAHRRRLPIPALRWKRCMHKRFEGATYCMVCLAFNRHTVD